MLLIASLFSRTSAPSACPHRAPMQHPYHTYSECFLDYMRFYKVLMQAPLQTLLEWT